jgi:putative Ca2+/H+ antiporter (TMEM165/GDT1 family)
MRNTVLNLDSVSSKLRKNVSKIWVILAIQIALIVQHIYACLIGDNRTFARKNEHQDMKIDRFRSMI